MDSSKGPDMEARRLRTREIAVCWLAATILALGVSPYWRINPDSALYTGLARSIASGEGYTFSGEVQASVPPVTPLCLAGVIKLSNLIRPDAPFAARFLYMNAMTAAAGMIALVGAFFLALELAGPRRAIAILLFLSLSYRFFAYAIEPLTDVPYCALSWWALVFLVRSEKRAGIGRGIAAALLLALSVLTRIVGVALVASVIASSIWRLARPGESRKSVLGSLATTVPAIVAASIFAWMMLHARGATFNYLDDVASNRSLQELLAGFISRAKEIPSYLFETVVGLESVGGLGLLLTAIAVAGAVRLGRRALLLSAYALFYLALTASAYKVAPRYFVPLLPIAYLFIFEGFSLVGAFLSKRLAPASAVNASRVVPILAVCVLAVNLVYTGREVARNFSSDFYASYKGGSYQDYLALAESVASDPPTGRIMARHSRIIFTLTAHETAWLPFDPDRPYRPTAADVADYVDKRGVGALVIDPKYAEDSEVFRQFILSRPDWVGRREFGRLTLATRGGDAAGQ